MSHLGLRRDGRHVSAAPLYMIKDPPFCNQIERLRYESPTRQAAWTAAGCNMTLRAELRFAPSAESRPRSPGDPYFPQNKMRLR
jgi:hypothetical protein